MPNGTYGGVRGRKTKVGGKLLLRFPPTRLYWLQVSFIFPVLLTFVIFSSFKCNNPVRFCGRMIYLLLFLEIMYLTIRKLWH